VARHSLSLYNKRNEKRHLFHDFQCVRVCFFFYTISTLMDYRIIFDSLSALKTSPPALIILSPSAIIHSHEQRRNCFSYSLQYGYCFIFLFVSSFPLLTLLALYMNTFNVLLVFFLHLLLLLLFLSFSYQIKYIYGSISDFFASTNTE
jgi:hypothetical protein